MFKMIMKEVLRGAATIGTAVVEGISEGITEAVNDPEVKKNVADIKANWNELEKTVHDSIERRRLDRELKNVDMSSVRDLETIIAEDEVLNKYITMK